MKHLSLLSAVVGILALFAPSHLAVHTQSVVGAAVSHPLAVPRSSAPLGAQAAATRPSRPLPVDYLEGFAEHRLVALHYLSSYFCPVPPLADTMAERGLPAEGPAATHPDEDQAAQCWLDDAHRGSPIANPRFGPDGTPIDKVGVLRGLVPFWTAPADPTNESQPVTYTTANYLPAAAGGIQTECNRRDAAIFQASDPPFTCLMHPSAIHETSGPVVPLGAHSHLLSVTDAPAQWWHVLAFDVKDKVDLARRQRALLEQQSESLSDLGGQPQSRNRDGADHHPCKHQHLLLLQRPGRIATADHRGRPARGLRGSERPALAHRRQDLRLLLLRDPAIKRTDR